MKTPKPLNKAQRARAERARLAHAELLRLGGAVAKTATTRDTNVVALLRDGVAPFVVVNETGIPATTMLHLVRKAKAAHPAGGAK